MCMNIDSELAKRILGVIWGVTEVKWNLIDFYIGFWGFNIDSEKEKEGDGKIRRFGFLRMGKIQFIPST